MIFEVTILGSSSATPIYQRHPTAQVLNIHEHLFLVDCGEGTLIQMNRYRVKFHRINHIFISHLHGDHYLGLMGLLSTMHLQGRANPLHLFAPGDLQEIIGIQLKFSQTVLRYEIIFHPLNPTSPMLIYEDDDIEISTIILNHRIPCTGFLFAEKQRQRKLLKEKLFEYQVPVSAYQDLKNGNDYIREDGRKLLNSELTGDPRTPRKYAFCSDTSYDERILPHIAGIDLLYHEATFMNDKVERASETFHTTAAQAATIALKANVKRLLIGHFSARYKNLYPLLGEAKEIFSNTTMAMEGDRFLIE
ncbi:MAG: ribonuclease Z [Bacteroidetes bacterium]|nr:ribonuclease Z [Bacteroidota bacterium]